MTGPTLASSLVGPGILEFLVGAEAGGLHGSETGEKRHPAPAPCGPSEVWSSPVTLGASSL